MLVRVARLACSNPDTSLAKKAKLGDLLLMFTCLVGVYTTPAGIIRLAYVLFFGGVGARVFEVWTCTRRKNYRCTEQLCSRRCVAQDRTFDSPRRIVSVPGTLEHVSNVSARLFGAATLLGTPCPTPQNHG